MNTRPLGTALAMRVLQSDLYRQLDDAERADCDELIAQHIGWLHCEACNGDRTVEVPCPIQPGRFVRVPCEACAE